MNAETSLITQVAGTVQSAVEATANTALAVVTPESKIDAFIGGTAAYYMGGQTYLTIAPAMINYMGKVAVDRTFGALLGSSAGQLSGRVLGPLAAAYIAPSAYATAVPLTAFAISSVTAVLTLNALKLARKGASQLFNYFSRNKGTMTVHQEQISKKELTEKAYLYLGIAPGSSQDQVRKAFKEISKVFHPDKLACREDLSPKERELIEAHYVNNIVSSYNLLIGKAS